MSNHVVRCALVFFAAVGAFAAPSLAVDVGDTPSFNVQAVGGGPLSLQKFKGKIIIVDFWATWCGPCMAEAAHMVELNKKYADKGVQIIGVTLDDDQAKMKSVVAASGFIWPQFYDGNGWKNRLAVEWGVDSIPATFIIDPSGKVVWRGHPANIDEQLEKAMQDTPPQLVDPDVTAAAKSAMEFVSANLESDAIESIKRMADVTAESRKDPVIAAQADALAPKIAAAAEKIVSEAEALITAKSYGEGVEKLKAIIAAMPGTELAAKLQKRINEVIASPEARAQAEAVAMETRAQAMFAAAQKLKEQKKDVEAYPQFKGVLVQYPKSKVAKEAATIVAAYEKDPAFVRSANDAATGGRAKAMLSLAQNYKSAGKSAMARAKFQAVIDEFPNTSYSEAAKKELKSLP